MQPRKQGQKQLNKFGVSASEFPQELIASNVVKFSPCGKSAVEIPSVLFAEVIKTNQIKFLFLLRHIKRQHY